MKKKKREQQIGTQGVKNNYVFVCLLCSRNNHNKEKNNNNSNDNECFL